ncbi:MAG: pilus assembly FimT family protein [Gemmatimonadaceae bacterium]
MMRRRGSTLVELLVTLVIMAIVASVATLVLGRPTSPPASADDLLREARLAAINNRRPTTLAVNRNGQELILTALPDGGVVADSGLDVDRLTGEPRHARP